MGPGGGLKLTVDRLSDTRKLSHDAREERRAAMFAARRYLQAKKLLGCHSDRVSKNQITRLRRAKSTNSRKLATCNLIMSRALYVLAVFSLSISSWAMSLTRRPLAN